MAVSHVIPLYNFLHMTHIGRRAIYKLVRVLLLAKFLNQLYLLFGNCFLGNLRLKILKEC